MKKEENHSISQAMFNAWCSRAYGIACAHGFHDECLPLGHWMMLVVTEISEMVEADRKVRYARIPLNRANTPFDDVRFNTGLFGYERMFVESVKDRFEDEMADVIIRICDYLGLLHAECGVEMPDVEIDMHAEWDELYRGMSVCRMCYDLVRMVARLYDGSDGGEIRNSLGAMVLFLFNMARAMDIDLAWHIDRKMDYNELRSYKHGKRY